MHRNGRNSKIAEQGSFSPSAGCVPKDINGNSGSDANAIAVNNVPMNPADRIVANTWSIAMAIALKLLGNHHRSRPPAFGASSLQYIE